MTKPSFTAQLRAIDDANLDPYQFRMVMHFWRVGKCFESLRTTAEKCGMSLGKASKVKQWLIDEGWIERTIHMGRVAVKLKDDICDTSQSSAKHAEQSSSAQAGGGVLSGAMSVLLSEENITKLLMTLAPGLEKKQSLRAELAKSAVNPEKLITILSPYHGGEGLDYIIWSFFVQVATEKDTEAGGSQSSPHEHRSYQGTSSSPHEQVQPVNVHHVNAILNEPLLNEPLLNDEDGSPIYVLCEHFKNLTGIFYNSNTPTFERDWKEPLTTLLERVGEIQGTKEVIEQAHKKMVAGKYRIATPSSIQTAAINIINGADGVKSHSDYRPLWNQVKAEITKNGRRSTHQWNGQIAPVLKKAGGYTRLCSLSTYDAEQTFKSAFQDTQ